jgi:hypothetical protein
VLTFVQFLLEYPVSDLRFFKGLPDVATPADVEKVAAQYHFSGIIHWKIIQNRAFNRSRELDDDIVAMVPGDIEENWYHELGHVIYDHSDKSKIIPVLDDIKDHYDVAPSDLPKSLLGLKCIEIGGYKYSYSHSGKDFEYDELFAISFAFYEGDKEKFDDPPIDKNFSELLKNLQDGPLFKDDPYTDHDSDGPVA